MNKRNRRATRRPATGNYREWRPWTKPFVTKEAGGTQHWMVTIIDKEANQAQHRTLLVGLLAITRVLVDDEDCRRGAQKNLIAEEEVCCTQCQLMPPQNARHG